MKLSQMNTDELSLALSIIAEPVGNICEDTQMIEKLSNVYYKEQDGKKIEKSGVQVMGGLIAKVLPWLLKDHQMDVYTILSALTGKTVEEIRAQNGLKTLMDARECFDKDLASFFTSFMAGGTEK